MTKTKPTTVELLFKYLSLPGIGGVRVSEAEKKIGRSLTSVRKAVEARPDLFSLHSTKYMAGRDYCVAIRASDTIKLSPKAADAAYAAFAASGAVYELIHK